MAKEKMQDNANSMSDNEKFMLQLRQLDAQNKALKNQLNQAIEEIKFLTQAEFHKKLEWLWKVITLENSAEVFSQEFYNTCVAEFTEMMTPQAPEEEAKETK